jgi:hypothetical protein
MGRREKTLPEALKVTFEALALEGWHLQHADMENRIKEHKSGLSGFAPAICSF